MAKGNPSFGITIDDEQFAEDCREAQESPAKENSFRRYRLNQWTEQDVRWLNMEKWDACAGSVEDLDGRQCYAGLDLSSTTDLSALVLVFPDDGQFDVLPFFWVPEEGAKQTRASRQGSLSALDRARFDRGHAGRSNRLRPIRHASTNSRMRFDIRNIAIDRWNATQLASQLENDGFEMVAFGKAMRA